MTYDGVAQAFNQALTLLCNSAHSDLLGGIRRIEQGDELALTGEECTQFRRSVARVRQASGAARRVARELLQSARAEPTWQICRQPSGAPGWPPGFVGSLSHDAEFAAALVAPTKALRSVGIDIEPSTPLSPDLIDIIATPCEQAALKDLGLDPKILFCTKEAVYKASCALDGKFLDFKDIEVCFKTQRAIIQEYYKVEIRALASPRIVALAFIAAT